MTVNASSAPNVVAGSRTTVSSVRSATVVPIASRCFTAASRSFTRNVAGAGAGRWRRGRRPAGCRTRGSRELHHRVGADEDVGALGHVVALLVEHGAAEEVAEDLLRPVEVVDRVREVADPQDPERLFLALLRAVPSGSNTGSACPDGSCDSSIWPKVSLGWVKSTVGRHRRRCRRATGRWARRRGRRLPAGVGTWARGRRCRRTTRTSAGAGRSAGRIRRGEA